MGCLFWREAFGEADYMPVVADKVMGGSCYFGSFDFEVFFRVS
jgi:hypothetical protein